MDPAAILLRLEEHNGESVTRQEALLLELFEHIGDFKVSCGVVFAIN